MNILEAVSAQLSALASSKSIVAQDKQAKPASPQVIDTESTGLSAKQRRVVKQYWNRSKSRAFTVSKLPFTAGWQDLKDLFRTCGTVLRTEIAMGQDNRSRGFGTVLFEKDEDAAKAIELYNNTDLKGRMIEVRLDNAVSGLDHLGQKKQLAPLAPVDLEAINSKSLYVGNLPFSIGWQELKDLFKEAGFVQRAEIAMVGNGTHKSRGFGLVVMGSVEDAKNAAEKFHGIEWNGRRLEVREDRSHPESRHGEYPRAPFDATRQRNYDSRDDHRESRDPSHRDASRYNRDHVARQAPPGRASDSPRINPDSITVSRKLYIGNIPFNFRWQEIKDLLRQYGTVVRADVVMDEGNRSRGYAEVIMGTIEEAQAVIDGLDEALVEGRTLDVREDKLAQLDQTNKIFIGNLAFSVRKEDLEEMIASYGVKPTTVTLSMDRDGRSRGFGTALFETSEDAKSAVGALNAREFGGRALNVKIDQYSY